MPADWLKQWKQDRQWSVWAERYFKFETLPCQRDFEKAGRVSKLFRREGKEGRRSIVTKLKSFCLDRQTTTTEKILKICLDMTDEVLCNKLIAGD